MIETRGLRTSFGDHFVLNSADLYVVAVRSARCSA